MVGFSRLDVEMSTRTADNKKIVDLKLKKTSPLPVSYRVSMKVGDIDLGTVAAGKLVFLKEFDIEIDEGVPTNSPVEVNVRSWGAVGIFFGNDEGTFEG